MNIKALLPSGWSGRGVLSVDLGSDILKMAYGVRGMGGRTRIAQIVSRNVQGLSDESISDVIRDCIREMNIGSPTVNCVVSPNLSITRNIEVPATDEDEVKDIVNLQASRHTPYAREDIIVDYIDMGIYQGAYTRVMLIVVSHDKIRRQFDVLELAGLKVSKVIFEPEALGRVSSSMLQLKSTPSPGGIIHLQANFTDFIVIDDDKPIFIRNIPIGTQHLVSEPALYQLQFTDEIRKSMAVYRTEEIGSIPDSFVISGAVEIGRDLKPILDDALKVPTEPVTYSRQIVISDEASSMILADRRVSFLGVVAAIYSYRETTVDLVPDEIRSKMLFEQQTREVVKTGVLVMMIVLLVAGILFNKIWVRNVQVSRLSSFYQSDLLNAKRMGAEWARIEALEDILQEGSPSLEVLRDVFSILPDDVRLKSVRFDRERDTKGLVIKGEAGDRKAVHAMMRDLTDSKLFSQVITGRQVSGEKYVNFEIWCDLAGRGEEGK